MPRADAALGATAGAKARVEKDYKATARDCMKTILVNDCLDRARLLQQKRLADIDAVELEANRYKRRDHADKLDADRSQREAERQARAPADADQREKNRKTFDDKQGQAARDVADRRKADAKRAQSPPRKPTAKAQSPHAPEVAAAQRAKNATDYTNKVKEVAEHEGAIQRNLAAKAADRKRRADAKAAKDAAAHVAPTPVAPPLGCTRSRCAARSGGLEALMTGAGLRDDAYSRGIRSSSRPGSCGRPLPRRSSTGSIRTMASVQLSPPPSARSRAISMSRSEAWRGG